ncbi:hypothetical protein [Aureivirga sp. CE67]|uniref:hypothetical protein n=1 Tax=Aureivirga sp. CE67 TaxID=1788983 RepID=UPI0018C9A2AA|nr:hypothetical protein [Aureivirga sp. CE67]
MTNITFKFSLLLCILLSSCASIKKDHVYSDQLDKVSFLDGEKKSRNVREKYHKDIEESRKDTIQKQFKSKEEEYNYYNKRIFSKTENRKKYKKHKGRIYRENKSKINYSWGRKFFIKDFKNADKYKIIFSEGLVSPKLIGNDFEVLNVEEFTHNMLDLKIKRFRLALANENFVGNNDYYIELYNENANEKMKFEDFIKGAELVFLSKPYFQEFSPEWNSDK